MNDPHVATAKEIEKASRKLDLSAVLRGVSKEVHDLFPSPQENFKFQLVMF